MQYKHYCQPYICCPEHFDCSRDEIEALWNNNNITHMNPPDQKKKILRQKAAIHPTPFYMFDKDILNAKYTQLKKLLYPCTIAYAMKANPAECVIKSLSQLGSSFELASASELKLLLNCNISTNQIMFGSATKLSKDILFFAKNGIDLYAADSIDELEKIAKFAPYSRVYVRLLVNDKSNSVYHLTEKFGANLDDFFNLAVRSKQLGLRLVGTSFNVGSQALNHNAWSNGIREISTLLIEASKHNIHLEHINIGGGFPVNHHPKMNSPTMEQIAKSINIERAKLPYPIKLTVEPGRWLVAEAFSSIAQVYSVKERGGRLWAFVDMGVYSGLFEALSCQGSIRYDIENITRNHNSEDRFVLAGPTCDDLDIIDHDVLLPSDTAVGDLIVIKNVGAYSIPLTTNFNGFPTPMIINTN